MKEYKGYIQETITYEVCVKAKNQGEADFAMASIIDDFGGEPVTDGGASWTKVEEVESVNEDWRDMKFEGVCEEV